MPNKLLLKPDLSTLKEVPWHKKEAMVFADVLCPETQNLVPYAPRAILKN
jgi:glutamine synthetase